MKLFQKSKLSKRLSVRLSIVGAILAVGVFAIAKSHFGSKGTQANAKLDSNFYPTSGSLLINQGLDPSSLIITTLQYNPNGIFPTHRNVLGLWDIGALESR